MAILRHITSAKNLPSILDKGVVPEGGSLTVRRGYDRGYVSFEKDPPTDWLLDNIHRLKHAFAEPAVALDFNEDCVRALGYEVKELPRGPIELLEYFHGDEYQLFGTIGVYVKVKGVVPLSCLAQETKALLAAQGYPFV